IVGRRAARRTRATGPRIDPFKSTHHDRYRSCTISLRRLHEIADQTGYDAEGIILLELRGATFEYTKAAGCRRRQFSRCRRGSPTRESSRSPSFARLPADAESACKSGRISVSRTPGPLVACCPSAIALSPAESTLAPLGSSGPEPLPRGRLRPCDSGASAQI